jgi:thiol-disulfide isomerase/thioredoxin
MIFRTFLLFACLLASTAQAADFIALDRHTARRLTEAESHRQPTIIALWSSDCSHCKKNLQLLADLRKANKRLQVITIAAESESTELAPMLDRYAIAGPRYAYGNDSPEAIAYAIDPNWAGELPRTFLFNGNGKKEKISGVISPQIAAKATGLNF